MTQVLQPIPESPYLPRHIYRPQRSWGKVVFTCVCDSVHRGGICLSACWDTTPEIRKPPWEQAPPGSRSPGAGTPPKAGTPREQTPPQAGTPRSRHPPEQAPPQEQTPPPPQHRACWEIRSTSGRYASYWNAILFTDNFSPKFISIMSMFAVRLECNTLLHNTPHISQEILPYLSLHEN